MNLTQWLQTTLSGLITLVTGTCLALPASGCIYPSSAARGYGYTQPDEGGAIVVRKTWGGAELIVGTDIDGHVKGTYNPETGFIDIDATLVSNASAIYDAQGRRITDNFVASRGAEIDAQRQVAFRALDTMDNALAMLGVVAPQAIPAYLQTMQTYAQTLRGSSASLDLGSLGSGAVNIGVPDDPAVAPPTEHGP